MDLLKEVAKDRLVVMVTHNPELAENYATRIVKLRDGRITDDSDPYTVDETALEDQSTLPDAEDSPEVVSEVNIPEAPHILQTRTNDTAQHANHHDIQHLLLGQVEALGPPH